MRRPLSLTLAILTPVVALGAVAPTLAARRKPAGIIKQVTVAPTKLRGGGSDVRVIAKTNQVLDPTVQLKAQAFLNGAGGGPLVTLARQNGTTYTGNVRVPVNYDRSTQRGNVTVTAVSGGAATQVKVVTLTVLPGGGDGPPPPPPAK